MAIFSGLFRYDSCIAGDWARWLSTLQFHDSVTCKRREVACKNVCIRNAHECWIFMITFLHEAKWWRNGWNSIMRKWGEVKWIYLSIPKEKNLRWNIAPCDFCSKDQRGIQYCMAVHNGSVRHISPPWDILSPPDFSSYKTHWTCREVEICTCFSSHFCVQPHPPQVEGNAAHRLKKFCTSDINNEFIVVNLLQRS